MTPDLASITDAFLEGWRDPSSDYVAKRNSSAEAAEEQRAWQLGKNLKGAYSLMRSADLVDFDADVARIQILAREARERYGEDFIDVTLPMVLAEPGFERIPITRYYVQHEGDATTPAMLLCKWEPDYTPSDLFTWCGGDTWSPREPFEDLVDDIAVSGPMSWFEVQTYLPDVLPAMQTTPTIVECTCRPGWLSEYGFDPWCKADEHSA